MDYRKYFYIGFLVLFSFACDTGSDGEDESIIDATIKLVAEDASTGAEFGKYVSISGDYAIVAAPGDTSDSGGRGAAYIFRYHDNNWAQAAKLKSDDSSIDGFGESVDIDDAYAFVGGGGSVIIFERVGEDWVQVNKLDGPNAPGGESFGESISVSGDYAIIGVPRVSVSSVPNVGMVYIYKRTEAGWSEHSQITCSRRFDSNCGNFGASVSINDAYALVGSPGANAFTGTASVLHIFELDTSANAWSRRARFTYGLSEQEGSPDAVWASMALKGNAVIVGGQLLRRAFVYEVVEQDWGQKAALKSVRVGSEFSYFGWDVALSDRYAAVSDVSASLSQSSLADDFVLLFEEQGNIWNEVGVVKVSEVLNGDFYGYSISLSRDNLIVGAPNQNSAGQGSGAAYIVNIPKFRETL